MSSSIVVASTLTGHAPRTRLLGRKDLPRSRKELTDRYEVLSALLREGIWDWNLVTGDVEYSSRWQELIGIDEADLGHSIEGWLNRIHPLDRPGVSSQLEALRVGRFPKIHNQHRLLHKDGEYRHVEIDAVALTDEEDTRRVVRVIGTISDVTKQRLVEHKLLFDTYHDPLTGLPNRTYFTALLDQAIDRRATDTDTKFGVIVIDLDRFNRINDGLGHSSGNKILLAATERLRHALRAEDVLARLAGDEFAILLDPVSSAEDVEKMAERLQSNLSRVFEIDGRSIFLSACAGIALPEEEGLTGEILLQNACAAANHAKSLGRARSKRFAPALVENRRDLIQRETELRQAIERHEFQLRYQPIICVETGRLSGFEALVRWEHPVMGQIEPSEFIPMTEETGLIIPLGQWILAEACEQMRDWQSRFPATDPLSISVNLSCRQLADPDLVASVQSIKQLSGLAPNTLRLEITESLMMEDTVNASLMVEKLRDLGIGIHVDDFGTGYSSLSTLPHLPIDTLKIDRSFIARMFDNSRTAQIVKTIISLAKTLDLDVTAEGVETREQLEQLRELGCCHAQGYYFSAPLDKEGAERLIQSHPTWM